VSASPVLIEILRPVRHGGRALRMTMLAASSLHLSARGNVFGESHEHRFSIGAI